jgi:hypothetical protein
MANTYVYTIKQTRCVIHNGLDINLILTIGIYDKLVITRGKIKKLIYFHVHHVVVKKKNSFFFFFFIFVRHISYKEPKRDLTLNGDMF